MRSIIFLMILLSFLLITPTRVYSVTLNQDISRFIYKYYQILPKEKLSTIVQEQLKKTYPCVDSTLVQQYISSIVRVNPGDFVRVLEAHIKTSNCIDITYSAFDINRVSKQEWMEYTKDSDIYLLYSSENGDKAESSLGHLSLMYKNRDEKYFYTVVTYSATDFNDNASTIGSCTNYAKGAFLSLAGQFSSISFFDIIHEKIVSESRSISCYKVNVSNEEKKIMNENVWEETQNKDDSYNFFKKNCSSEITKLIPGVDDLFWTTSFQTPSKLVRKLESNSIVTYEGTYRAIEDEKGVGVVYTEDERYNRVQYAYNHHISASNYDKKLLLEFTLFHSARPTDGIVEQKTNLTLLQIEALLHSKEYGIKSVAPISFSYNPHLLPFLGLKLDYQNIYEDYWQNNFKMGGFLFFKPIKMQLYYLYPTHSDAREGVYCDLIFSNRIIDVTIQSEKDFYKQDSFEIDFIGNIFLHKNIAFFCRKRIKEYSVGASLYW